MTTTATTEPVTVAVADWAEAEAYLHEHSSNAYTLEALTALHDADLHHIMLDPEAGVVWWAWDLEPVEGVAGWKIEQLPPEQALDRLGEVVDTIQDRMDAPEEAYAYGGCLETDQEALDEYTAVMRLTLPKEPAQARSHIARRRERLRRTDELWQRTYAALVRDLTGDERGGQARSARALGVTQTQVARILREDARRRERLRARVAQVRG